MRQKLLDSWRRIHDSDIDPEKLFLKKQYRPEELDNLVRENVELLSKGKAIKGAREGVSDLYAAIELIRNSDSMSPKDKTEEINKLRAQLNTIYDQVIEGIEDEE